MRTDFRFRTERKSAADDLWNAAANSSRIPNSRATLRQRPMRSSGNGASKLRSRVTWNRDWRAWSTTLSRIRVRERRYYDLMRQASQLERGRKSLTYARASNGRKKVALAAYYAPAFASWVSFLDARTNISSRGLMKSTGRMNAFRMSGQWWGQESINFFRRRKQMTSTPLQRAGLRLTAKNDRRPPRLRVQRNNWGLDEP